MKYSKYDSYKKILTIEQSKHDHNIRILAHPLANLSVLTCHIIIKAYYISRVCFNNNNNNMQYFYSAL